MSALPLRPGFQASFAPFAADDKGALLSCAKKVLFLKTQFALSSLSFAKGFLAIYTACGGAGEGFAPPDS
jgi:hypothetical protein